MLSQIAKSLEGNSVMKSASMTSCGAATRKSGPPAPLRMPPHARAILHRAGDSVTDVEFVPPESPFYRLSEELRVARAQNAFGVAQLGATASAAEKARLDGELAELQRKASDTTAYGCDRVAALNEYAKLYYGL